MTNIYLGKLLSYQLLPPALLCYLLLIGLILCAWRRRRAGYSCIIIAGLLLYALSLPPVAYHLAQPLQPKPMTRYQLIHTKAQAIVVLSGGSNYYAPEYQRIILSNTNLIRLRYAAYIAKLNHLPILLSGASLAPKLPADAQTMSKTLQELWGIKARWVESRSYNTAQNANYSCRILKQQHITKILLVTSATHMRRAALTFRQQHLQVIPAATDYIGTVQPSQGAFRFIPRASAFMKSYLSYYEYLGLLWYRLHGQL